MSVLYMFFYVHINMEFGTSILGNVGGYPADMTIGPFITARADPILIIIYRRIDVIQLKFM